MSSIGKISLDLNVNNKGFKKQVNEIESSTKKAFNSMSVAVGNIMSDLITKAVKGIGNFVKDSIDKGSELSEIQNVVDSVFSTMADDVERFSKNALVSYGLTESQSKKMIGIFGAMSKSFGFSEKQAYATSTALTGLTGDVASFYNLSHDEAYTKLKSVFTGETEALKELGVVMTQTALDEFALANGFGKTTSSMSEQEKVALRLAFVQDKLSTATGDFTRTQDQWANQTRILTGQFESLKAAIGQGLISVLTPVIRVINEIMAKLVQLAQAFANFMAMITGKGKGGGIGKQMQAVSEAAESAATSTEGIESAASGASGAAKEAKKSLMGFDEINKLQDNSSGGGGGGGGSSTPLDFGFDIAEQENIAEASINKMNEVVSKLIDELKEGFKIGLGDDFEESLDRINSHLSSIKKQFVSLFTDPEIVASAYNLALNIARTIGKVAGSFISVGTTLAENLIGGFDMFLQNNSGFIKDRIVSIFNSAAEGIKQIGDFTAAFSDVFSVFRNDDAKSITGNLIGIFTNTFLSVKDLAFRFGTDIISIITQPFIDNKDAIKTALENILAPINQVLTVLNEGVKDTFNKIFEVYESNIAPLFDSIKNGLSSIVSTLLDAFNTYIAPILDSLASKFGEVWSTSIQPMINQIIEFVGKVANVIKEVWENILVPLINWIIKTLVPVIAPIIKTLIGLALTIFGKIADIISGIIQTLGGLIDFIVGVFTGDWSLAWEGIKSVFEGIWTAIKGFLSGIWEAIKGLISTALGIIKGIISTVFSIIKGIIETVWNTIKSIFTTAIEGITSAVTLGFTAIKDFITNIFNTVKDTATNIWNGIKSAISTAVNSIKDGIVNAFTVAYNTITGLFNNLASFFSGVWGKIKSTFTDLGAKISDAISGAVKSGVNGLFSAVETIVNGFIGAINGAISIINAIPGVKISKLDKLEIPKLAEGGYVKANQPQPVIIGDNKTQGEIVSPEGKMLEIMLAALEQFFGRLKDMGYNKEGSDYGDLIIPIYLDGTLLDEVIITAQQRRNIRSGGR